MSQEEKGCEAPRREEEREGGEAPRDFNRPTGGRKASQHEENTAHNVPAYCMEWQHRREVPCLQASVATKRVESRCAVAFVARLQLARTRLGRALDPHCCDFAQRRIRDQHLMQLRQVR